MGARLRRFNAGEIVLTEKQASDVLRFFFKTVPNKLTVEDRGFAQALLIEALEASYQIGIVEDLFRSLAKLPQGLKATIKAFGKRALKRWFKHATTKDIMDDPKIYEVVRNTIRRNFNSVWQIRIATGELTY